MFEAGSLIYRIQTVGAGLFKAELAQAEAAAKKASDKVKETAQSTKGLGEASRTTKPRLHEITGELRNMSDEAQQASRDVGGTLTAIGAGVVALVGLTVKAASDWESAWAGVTKTVNGTPEELQAVEDGLRGLTKELPAAHTEIAAVAEAAGQLGVQTGNVVAFTKTMVDLGETTNLSAQTAATELARFMNVMGTSQDRVSNLGSAVVELGNNYATTEAEIVSMAQRLSGAGRQVGLTEGEVLGLATALSSVGIEAEAGGSAISKVMIEIASQVETGGDKLETFARVAGLSSEEFVQKWRTDPGAALADFVAGLANMESQGQSTFGVLEELQITEVRMRDALLRSSAASDQFSQAMLTGNEATEENIALQQEAEKRYDTAASKMAMAKNEIVDMAIELGEHLLPAVVAVVEGVGDFAASIGALPDEMQSAIAVGAALIGMIALAGGTALIAIPKIVAFRVAVSTLTTTMPKAMGAVKGFASFLGGPWGVAIAAGVTALMLLDAALQSGQASSEEISNALVTAKDSADQFAALGQGKEIVYFRDVTADLENMSGMLDKVRHENDNWWARFTTETHGFRAAVREAGDELANLAQQDLPTAQEAFRTFTEGQNLSDEQMWTLIESSGGFKDALIEQATALGINVSNTDDMTARQELLKLATGDVAAETDKATESTKSAAAAYVEAAGATSQLESDLSALLDMLNEANETNQDAISSNIDYKNTLAEIDEAIRLAREGTEGYSLGLDDNTQAGRDNMSMLLQLAEDARQVAEDTFAADGSVEGLRQRLVDSRDDLIQRAMDYGYTRDEAQALADTILKMPTEHEFQVIADTRTAQNLIDGFILTNTGRRISVNVDVNGGRSYRIDGTNLVFQSEGSVRKAADGFVEPMSHQQAQMRRGGSYVLWAEDETQGETFIPHAPSKRGRSEKLLAETASLFGGTYVPGGATVRPMADGGMSGAVRGNAQPAGRGSEVIRLHPDDIRGIAEAVSRMDRRKARTGSDI